MTTQSRRTSIVLALLAAALGILGLLWLTCWLVSGFRFPVDGYGAWNLVAASALLITALLLLWRARQLARRSGTAA